MTATASVILAMHARFEAASEECNTIDRASSIKTCITEDRRDNLHAAISESIREQDALRLAILLQVPDTHEEAAALAFHISLSRDAEETAPTEEREALTVAIDTLFDFMACELATQHQAGRMGRDFDFAAEQVRKRRRLRTGEVEA